MSIGILTRDFWGDCNSWNPLLTGSLEKLKTEFPYPCRLAGILKKGVIFYFPFILLTVNCYKKIQDIIFVEKNTVYIFCHNFFLRIVIIFELIVDNSQKIRGRFA